MILADLVSPGRTVCSAEIGSKKKVLEELSNLLSQDLPSRTQGEIFDSLVNRERLGSTGLGHGIAIPHGRMAGLTEPIGAFISLAAPIDYDAIDDEAVDLLFALVVPEQGTEEHLQLLAQVAEMFNQPEFVRRLREASSGSSLFELLSHWEPKRATA